MASSSVFSGLTRKHGIKVGAGSPCSVEEVALAVGEIIGHGSVKSAARMNSAVVLFLDKLEQVNRLVETGITVNAMFEPVLPLAQPATKITLSNVPPFISDEFLIKELSRHGKVISPVRKLLSGCKSPLLRHVVSHRRQLFMILNNKNEEFDYRFRVRVDEFDYILFASSSSAKCFGCGEEGHLIKACPGRGAAAAVATAAAGAAPTPVGRRGAAAAAVAAVSRPVPAVRRAAAVAGGGAAAAGGTEVSGEREEVTGKGEVTGDTSGKVAGEVVKDVGEAGEGKETGEVAGEVGEENNVAGELEEGGESGEVKVVGEAVGELGEVSKATSELCERVEVAGDQCEAGEEREAVSLEAGDPGEPPLICIVTAETETGEERGVGADHVTAQMDTVLDEEMFSDEDLKVSQKRKSTRSGSSNSKMSRRGVKLSQNDDSDLSCHRSHRVSTLEPISRGS